MFQSRSGFSGPCDRPTAQRGRRADPRVSIPFWVFWSLRHHSPRISSGCVGSFNPVLGFLVPATRRSRIGLAEVERRFNPVLGFLVPATQVLDCSVSNCSVSIPFWVFWSLRRNHGGFSFESGVLFQSRSGFSGPCDSTTAGCRAVSDAVSIPFWVFWSLRPPLRAGDRCPCRFNPVLGFLVPATVPLQNDDVAVLHVSIPFWVFWSLRLEVVRHAVDVMNFVSIPFWVFWSLRHAETYLAWLEA